VGKIRTTYLANFVYTLARFEPTIFCSGGGDVDHYVGTDVENCYVGVTSKKFRRGLFGGKD
jgi:hypothetical protein